MNRIWEIDRILWSEILAIAIHADRKGRSRRFLIREIYFNGDSPEKREPAGNAPDEDLSCSWSLRDSDPVGTDWWIGKQLLEYYSTSSAFAIPIARKLYDRRV